MMRAASSTSSRSLLSSSLNSVLPLCACRYSCGLNSVPVLVLGRANGVPAMEMLGQLVPEILFELLQQRRFALPGVIDHTHVHEQTRRVNVKLANNALLELHFDTA